METTALILEKKMVEDSTRNWMQRCLSAYEKADFRKGTVLMQLFTEHISKCLEYPGPGQIQSLPFSVLSKRKLNHFLKTETLTPTALENWFCECAQETSSSWGTLWTGHCRNKFCFPGSRPHRHLSKVKVLEPASQPFSRGSWKADV